MPAAPAIEKQGTFEEVSEEYAAFLDKFKPKKTTDDCYTPPAERAGARFWPLSDRERQICAMLERKSNNPPTP
ncbi:MAG: hypothetical protein IJ678_06805 [Kiritimatiellae bacterium]|nr:hypothetical protein [Kiritimatiellia bacterium]